MSESANNQTNLYPEAPVYDDCFDFDELPTYEEALKTVLNNEVSSTDECINAINLHIPSENEYVYDLPLSLSSPTRFYNSNDAINAITEKYQRNYNWCVFILLIIITILFLNLQRKWNIIDEVYLVFNNLIIIIQGFCILYSIKAGKNTGIFFFRYEIVIICCIIPIISLIRASIIKLQG